MEINQGNLKTLYTSFKANFQNGLGMVASQYEQIATVVPSSTSSEEYGWLGEIPNMREWIGDRVVHGLADHGYTIKNKPFEVTIEVPSAKIDDDQYGIYAPMFKEMGRSAQAQPDQLVFGLLAGGRAANCYDGTPFFGTAHSVLNEKGKPTAVSNIDDAGGGTNYWYVLDTSRAIKPLIFQQRKAPKFVAKDSPTDDNVFDRATFKYGVDSRCNAGFGFWQMAQSSNKALTSDNLWAAIQALEGRTGDHGRKLGLRSTLLVFPSTLEKDATKLLNNELIIEGGVAVTNELKGRLKGLKADWL
ncbi:Mu-like prophage major head subunit gpT family protein [Variovorax sp.]|uniref:Mu-like prophage major head subunit gpT family protein n=1 Tax=Variovorax sp. TaxID=1871043 RepID=UPI003BA9ADD7